MLDLMQGMKEGGRQVEDRQVDGRQVNLMLLRRGRDSNSESFKVMWVSCRSIKEYGRQVDDKHLLLLLVLLRKGKDSNGGCSGYAGSHARHQGVWQTGR